MSSSTASSTDNITFEFDPTDNLSFYTTYKIKVTTGASDLAGNNLASEYVMSNGFTTKYWTRQLGTSAAEEGRGVAKDGSNNIYVTGGTYGGLDSNTSFGGQDIFLVKYNSDAEKQWTRQLGSSSNDTGRGVAVDSSNNIYVTGITEGGLDGYTNLGEQDIFLVKYDSNGNKKWTRQMGTSKSDIAHGIAVDSSNNIYVTGETRGGLDNNTNIGDKDIFLVKYDSNGNRNWTLQPGTDKEDAGYGITVVSNNVYVTGVTYGGLDSNSNAGSNSADIFLVKYSSAGVKDWTKQLGTTSEDVGYAVAGDSNSPANIYVTGYTKGNLGTPNNAGNSDIFLAKYYDNSTHQSTILLGSSNAEVGRSVTVNNSNNVYLTGDNETNSGDYDAFLVKYTSSGSSPVWYTKMDNSSSAEHGYGVVTVSSTFIYAVGNTGGGLDNNTNSGLQDVFLFKYADNGTKQ